MLKELEQPLWPVRTGKRALYSWQVAAKKYSFQAALHQAHGAAATRGQPFVMRYDHELAARQFGWPVLLHDPFSMYVIPPLSRHEPGRPAAFLNASANMSLIDLLRKLV